MNIQRYTLPVVVAAGLHGALFLSSLFAPSGTAFATPPKKTVVREIKIDDPIVQEPEKLAEADVTPAAPSPLGEPRPELPPPPPDETTSAFPQPDLPRQQLRIADMGADKIGPPGSPDGSPFWNGAIGGPKVFGLENLDRAPNARVQRAPDYPMALKQQGIGGSVVVEFTVDVEGKVVSASAVRYSHSEFVEPALRAVRSWRFEPGRHHGRPVSFRMMIPIEFGISETD